MKKAKDGSLPLWVALKRDGFFERKMPTEKQIKEWSPIAKAWFDGFNAAVDQMIAEEAELSSSNPLTPSTPDSIDEDGFWVWEGFPQWDRRFRWTKEGGIEIRFGE